MNRRTFLSSLLAGTLLTSLPFQAAGFDRQHRISIARLRYAGGNDDPRPGALRRLLQEVDKRTSIEVDTDIQSIPIEREALFDHPFVVLAGDRGFDPFTDEMIAALRTYLLAGGFLLIDSSEGLSDGPFLTSARREIARIFPRRELITLPRDHTVHQSFYLIDRPVGRIDIAGNFQAVFEEDRACVLLSTNDLLGALARDTFGNWEYNVTPGGDRQREMAFRLAINIMMYALTVDYKTDQVHIPFILRRRRWRVE